MQYRWTPSSRIPMRLLRPGPEGRRSPCSPTPARRTTASARSRPRHSTLSAARSRLYQRRFSRRNTHFLAFFKIYKKIILSRANVANFCQKIAKFCKILRNFAQCLHFLQKFARSACEKMIFVYIAKNAEKCAFGRENRR